MACPPLKPLRPPGIRLENQANEGHAAMAGQGFALLTPLLWKGDVAAGRLCVPFPDRVSARGWAYWLVYPKERRMVPKVKRFREWLVEEMARAIEDLDGGWARRDPRLAMREQLFLNPNFRLSFNGFEGRTLTMLSRVAAQE